MAFGRTSRAVDTGSETRALQVMPWGPWGPGSVSATGRQVSPQSASQLLTVFGCAQLIGDTIATLPRGVFTDTPEKTELDNVPPWFKKPNPTTTMSEYVGQCVWSLLMDGNIFAPYSLDAAFRTNGLSILDPTQVVLRADNPDRIVPWVNGKRFVGNLKHVKGLTQPGALRGINPIEAARQSISIALEAQDFAARFYNNGAHLSGVITTPQHMDQENAKALLDKFGRDHSGTNAHKPGLLDAGATWQPISITPEQAQFLETRRYQDADIAGKLFLLDPTLLGIPVSISETYANLEQRGIHLITYTLLRWMVRLEDFFTDLLPAGQYMKFNVNGLLRADLLTRYQAHQMALGGPRGEGVRWMTVEEVREIEELEGMPAELKKDFVAPAILDVQATPAKAPVPGTPGAPPVPAAPAPQMNFTISPEIRMPDQPAPIVTVNTPDITVNTPEVTFPEIRIPEQAPPHVTVNPPEIVVNPPEVTVMPAEVTVNAPDVHVTNEVQPRTTRRIERDEDGRILTITEDSQ